MAKNSGARSSFPPAACSRRLVAPFGGRRARWALLLGGGSLDRSGDIDVNECSAAALHVRRSARERDSWARWCVPCRAIASKMVAEDEGRLFIIG